MLTTNKIIESWSLRDFKTNSNDDILDWVHHLNQNTKVSIQKCRFDECIGWHLNAVDGSIENDKGGFFKVIGYDGIVNNNRVQQPIIIQNEIGYLGMICSIKDGVLQFLIQAKIEPGNVNKIQLSPTIQATKSNFTQVHGGKKPAYLDYFLNANKKNIVVDQIQSEQASRFLKKRNRNIIIFVKDDISILPNFKWMTLGQIKHLMQYDNLVNMDTRTVLSCLPIWQAQNFAYKYKKYFKNQSFFKSMFNNYKIDTSDVFNYFNNYKMFNDSYYNLVPIKDLNNWMFNDYEVSCKSDYFFKVIFCNIEIEGREVKNWCQPLFEACGKSLFGLMLYDDEGVIKIIVKAKCEVGTFDKIELGPSIQKEPIEDFDLNDKIEVLFKKNLNNNVGILRNCLLSEEGGRFYCEENRNIIMLVDKDEVETLPHGYFSLDYKTLNYLVQFNNVLNIQLRNLLSMLEI